MLSSCRSSERSVTTFSVGVHYRRHHSCTETALLLVLSDVYAAGHQDVTLLGLLDPRAASTVSTTISSSIDFESRLAFAVWIQSFLHGQTQQVSYSGVLSTLIVLTLGVPQGSVLLPSSLMLSSRSTAPVISASTTVRKSHQTSKSLIIQTV